MGGSFFTLNPIRSLGRIWVKPYLLFAVKEVKKPTKRNSFKKIVPKIGFFQKKV
jgi:hypothetical protein